MEVGREGSVEGMVRVGWRVGLVAAAAMEAAAA